MNERKVIQSVDLVEFLTYASVLIRELGYLSGKEAREQGKESTGKLAWQWATCGRNQQTVSMQISAQDKVTAKLVADWMKEIPIAKCIGNDYMANLQGIGATGIVGEKFSGYAASAISAYQKDHAVVNPKNFLGKIGEKISAKVTYEKMRGFDSVYGYSYVHTFRSENGDILVWITSKSSQDLGNICCGDGLTYTLTGTVKKHTKFKDICQTEITRAKIKPV